MKQILKYFMLFLVVACAFSGCSLIKVDEERDNAQIVVEFKGGSITKGEAMKEYDAVVETYEMYGITDTATLESIIPELLDYLAGEKIVELKATEMSLMEASEEEKASIRADVEKQYEEAIEQYKDMYREDDMTDEEARQVTIEAFEEEGYTVEARLEYELKEAWKPRLQKEVTKDVAFTEEDIQSAFDEHVSEDEQQYSGNPTAFENAMEGEEVVTWYPEGYRTEKHILIALSDEQLSELNSIKNQILSIDDEIVTIDEELNAAAGESGDEATVGEEYDGVDSGIDPDVMDEGSVEADGEKTMTEEELLKKKAELESEKADLENQIDSLKAEYKAALQGKVDEVFTKIDAGEDFDALIAEYGKDTLMDYEPVKTKGAYVSLQTADKEKELVDAAMALEAIGDVGVSELSDSGIYIVRYISDVPAGAVELADVRLGIEDEVLTKLKEEYYTELKDQWVEDADVKTYADRMKKLT